MTIGVYKFTNKENGKIYIGQSVNIEKRYREHISNSKNVHHQGYNCKFYNALRKYGENGFTFDIIETLDKLNKDSLNKKEIYWIDYYDSYNKGYNSNKGGEKVTERLEDHPMAKLTNDIVLTIKEELLKKELSQHEIAEKYNISQSEISHINLGERWNELGDYVYPIRPDKKSAGDKLRKYSDDLIMQIRKDYVSCSLGQLENKYCDIIPKSQLKQIVYGTRYKHLPIYKKREKIWINN